MNLIKLMCYIIFVLEINLERLGMRGHDKDSNEIIWYLIILLF